LAKSNIGPAHRKAVLQTRQQLKMAESAHAYVRGNTVRFYEWLKSRKVQASIPAGPDIWICGDCHTGNLGPVADVEGNIDILIRDLDQTVVGNPAHDLLRLGLSLAMAARSSDLPGVTTALMMEEIILGYIAGLSGRYARVAKEDIEPIRRVMRAAKARQWKHLAEERIEDVRPRIPLGAKFWPLAPEEQRAMQTLFEREDLHGLMEKIVGSTKDRKIKLIDAAYWMKGCSSLGRLRYAALVESAGRKHGRYHLLDIKEATSPFAPAAKKARHPLNNAERVVTGAQALSPSLGDRMLAATFLGRQVVVRELRPQDLKFELNELQREEAVAIARLMAGVVGRAHGRQMDRPARQAWIRTLRQQHSKGLDAPRWLWSGVLDLAALHEAAYLEHCRRYALGHAG
jgi:uncharacterized protein (DUF2252 family)